MLKFLIKRNELFSALKRVVNVVDQRPLLPILGHIALSLEGTQLKLTASDGKLEMISETVLCDPVSELFNVTVPGRKLVEICRTLPEDATIEGIVQDGWISIHSSGARFKLATLPPESFPHRLLLEDTVSLVLPERVCRSLIGRTHFSMAHQDARYCLNGLLLEVTPDYVRLVATDGHRMALDTYRYATQLNKTRQCILPKKTVTELIRLLSDSDNELTIEIDKNHFRMVYGHTVLTSHLIDGRYPVYQKVIPKHGDNYVLVDRLLLEQALQRAMILANEKFLGVRISINSHALDILAHNSSQEGSEEQLTIDYQGDPIVLHFNINYLLDALGVIETEQVKLIFSSPNEGILIMETDKTEDNAFVIMPIIL